MLKIKDHFCTSGLALPQRAVDDEAAPRAAPHVAVLHPRRHVDEPRVPGVELLAAAWQHRGHTVYAHLLVTTMLMASAAAAASRRTARRCRTDAILLDLCVYQLCVELLIARWSSEMDGRT